TSFFSPAIFDNPPSPTSYRSDLGRRTEERRKEHQSPMHSKKKRRYVLEPLRSHTPTFPFYHPICRPPSAKNPVLFLVRLI
ncbi:hypothetical protein COCMIDRAFT_108861, partial [Bipolaris oryzae ATCC 44560]